MTKKRFFFTFFLLLFITFLGGFSTNCRAYTIYNGAIQLRSGEVLEIVNSIHAENKFSGDLITSFTETFNRWSRLTAQTIDFNKQNLLFFRVQSQDRIGWTLVNGTSGTFPYAYLNSNNNYDSYINNQAYNYIYLSDFTNWTLNNSGEPTGTVRGNASYWYISATSNPSQYQQVNGIVNIYNLNPNNQGMSVTVQETINGGAYEINIPSLVALSPTHIVYAYTYLYGRNSYFLSNFVNIIDESNPSPTPTPTLTPTPSGDTGGGGSTDLGPTNRLIETTISAIDNVNNTIAYESDLIREDLSHIEDKIPTSGEISSSVEEATSSYWGDSSSFNGDNEVDSISGDIIGSINNFSGELSQNEIFGALEDFEHGFFNLFVERDPLALDLVVSWPNIYSLADGNEEFLISSGELNFSEMCRDNETLGNIQSVVRVIFNFYFGFSLLTYLYNLVLSTLGIDNPFLYDNPENGYEDIVYDINTGTETSYYHQTFPNSYRRHQTIVRRRK